MDADKRTRINSTTLFFLLSLALPIFLLSVENYYVHTLDKNNISACLDKKDVKELMIHPENHKDWKTMNINQKTHKCVRLILNLKDGYKGKIYWVELFKTS